MLLTYSHERFPALIKSGVKIHTIREDMHNRWKPGMRIHHWMHNPRNVHKHPFFFLENTCVGVQKISLKAFITKTGAIFKHVEIEWKFMREPEIEDFSINDGFENSDQLFHAIFPKLTDRAQWWRGKIIHWTDKRY